MLISGILDEMHCKSHDEITAADCDDSGDHLKFSGWWKKWEIKVNRVQNA